MESTTTTLPHLVSTAKQPNAAPLLDPSTNTGTSTATSATSATTDGAAAASANASGSSLQHSVASTEDAAVVFEGSKLFWRHRLNVELHFIHHTKRNCLEIMGYITEKDAELQHIFVDYTSLMTQIEPMLSDRIETMRAEVKKDRFKRVPSDEELRAIAVKKGMEDYLLGKLSLDQDETTQALQLNLVQHAVPGEPTDTAALKVMAGIPPEHVNPTKIRRRRRTTAEEYHQLVTDVRNDSKMIQNACTRADQLTDLSNMVIERFKEGMASLDLLRQHQQDIQRSLNMSTARKRWLWAIKKVLRQKAVARMKLLLQKYATKSAFSPSGVNGFGNSVNNPKTQAKLVRAPTQIQDRISSGNGGSNIAHSASAGSSSNGTNPNPNATSSNTNILLSKQQRRVSRGSLGSAYAKPSLGTLSESNATSGITGSSNGGGADSTGAGALDGSKSSTVLPRLNTMRRSPSLDGYMDISNKSNRTTMLGGQPPITTTPLLMGGTSGGMSKHKLSTVGENMSRDTLLLLRQQTLGAAASSNFGEGEDGGDGTSGNSNGGDGTGNGGGGMYDQEEGDVFPSGFIDCPSVDVVNDTMSDAANSMVVVLGVVGTHAKAKPIRRARSTNIQLPNLPNK